MRLADHAHIISVNEDRFVQHVDRHGIGCTEHPRSATAFHGTDMLKAISLVIHHEPEAIITLIPRTMVARAIVDHNAA